MTGQQPDRWPTEEYLRGLGEALRLMAESLVWLRGWLAVIIALLGLILWRVW